MNNKYIDKDTYEVVDNIFEVDEAIADTISILNKKGYYTLYSCSGHVKNPRIYEKYPLNSVDDYYESYIVDEKYVLVPFSYTYIYILFDKHYHFNILPSKFHYDSKNIISQKIFYYEKGIKKKSANIQKEIDDANNELLEWAKKLSNNILLKI